MVLTQNMLRIFDLLFSAANVLCFKFTFYYMFLKMHITQHQNTLM